ncbi:MAG: type II toxin-antitoxin system VapC family toxin [Ignavibacteriales bacterium]
MRAIDTNIVVRFLTNDDKRQAHAARTAIEGGDIFIATTVLLESEWVLRSAYGFDPAQIAAAFRGLAGLPSVSVEDPVLLAQALDRLTEGMDFADALHLAKAEHCDVFLSFDRKLATAAKGRAPIPVEVP